MQQISIAHSPSIATRKKQQISYEIADNPCKTCIIREKAMPEEKIRIGHSGHGYFWSKSFNSLLSRNMTYSKKMKQTPPATRVHFIFKKLAIIAT